MDSILAINDVCKSFGTVSVLKNVNLSIDTGEVHALLGANGAGKSTLIKIIGGIIEKSSGEIVFRGNNTVLRSPIDAGNCGIRIIHQELSIIPQLTVLENFFLGREFCSHGLLDRTAMINEYNRICAEMNFDIPWDAPAKTLTIAKHQMIEIMKAISQNAELIIMDEPTTSLTDPEKQTLFKIVQQLQIKGKTIIYISHMLDEIFALCGRASILRGGENMGTFPIGELTKEKIAELMAGKTWVKRHKRSAALPLSGAPVLRVENLTRKNKFKNISFTINSGEILGLAGLVGSGRSEIARALFGADLYKEGAVFIDGHPVKIRSPKDAIALGIGLIPEDRKTQGLILKQEIYKNTDILNLGDMKTAGLLDKRKEFSFAQKALETLHTKFSFLTQKTSRLSGGNQQKVAVSKWYGKKWKVLIFDEPTKGIDINAKEDIFMAVENFAAQGAGVLFISSDLEEVLRVSDRILVIHDGEVVNIRENHQTEIADLMRDMLLHACSD